MLERLLSDRFLQERHPLMKSADADHRNHRLLHPRRAFEVFDSTRFLQEFSSLRRFLILESNPGHSCENVGAVWVIVHCGLT
jgi:hypothetical protein